MIASRCDWHWSKGLLKGFKLALRPWESSKNWWRYDQMKFVTLLLLSKLTSMQIKYSILKILWNICRSQVEFWLSSSSFSSSIQNRSWSNIWEISLCLLLSSPSLTFFFNKIHFLQLSYCSLTATLRKRYTIAPKKETPTLDPSLNEQLSILCIYKSQWTPSTKFIIEEFIGILSQHHSRKQSFWERRPELSHTLQALHHSCRVLSPLYLGPGFQSRYRESREV